MDLLENERPAKDFELRCLYCGRKYIPETPTYAVMQIVAYEHAQKCPNNPLVQRLNQVKTVIEGHQNDCADPESRDAFRSVLEELGFAE